MIELLSPLNLEEVLRAVGQALEGRGVSYVEIRLAPLGITIETTQPYARQDYSWGNLGIRVGAAGERAATAAAPASWHDLRALTRWSVLLALVG